MIKNFMVWVLGLSILTSGCLMPGISLCGINTAIEFSPLSGEVTDIKKNVWTPQDEGDHYPCTREWWNIDSFFTCNNKSWSVTASVGYEIETPACNMFFTLFDGESGKYYPFGSFDDPIGTLIHKKDTVDLTYGKSTIKGLYPNYVIHLEDPRENTLQNQTIKTMASGGNKSTITINNKAVDLKINGKPVIIVTSLKASIDDEGCRRWDALRIDTSKTQTNIIKKRILEKASGIKKHEANNNLRHALQYLLQPNEVIIPYARELFKLRQLNS